jgi:hypothetical protein
VVVDIHSDRHFGFDVGHASVWTAISRVDQYQEWWPWLHHFDGDALREGERWQCVVKPPLPYRLRFDVVLVEVVDRDLVRARVDGDITGSARLDVIDHGRRSELRLRSELVPADATLRLIARLARPVVTFGHEWVLDTGVRQFRAAALRT